MQEEKPRRPSGGRISERFSISRSIFATAEAFRGRDFRLDIAGDEIADGDVGDAIVLELRLLMVGEVRIRNKRIIEERHKQADAASTAADRAGAPLHVDLSHGV